MIRTLYHGTDVSSAESIRRTALRPRRDWQGLPENHWILTSTAANAWQNACAQAGRSADKPDVLAFWIPEDQWSDYIRIADADVQPEFVATGAVWALRVAACRYHYER